MSMILTLNDLSKTSTRWYRWLEAFPPVSRDRLTQVNLSATTSRHIILTLSFGVFDPNIRALNRVIINLMLYRMRCEKKGDLKRRDAIEQRLEDLHAAIDAITGTTSRHSNSGEVCKAPARSSRHNTPIAQGS